MPTDNRLYPNLSFDERWSNVPVPQPQPIVPNSFEDRWANVPTTNPQQLPQQIVAGTVDNIDTARGAAQTASNIEATGANIGGPMGPMVNAASRVVGAFLRIKDPDNPENRFQFWPERMVRSAVTLPVDVLSGDEPIYDPRTGKPRIDEYGELFGVRFPISHFAGRVQDLAGLAGTGGFAARPGEATLGAGPTLRSLRPVLKYEGKVYKGRVGQEHTDIIPENLRSTFEQMAMTGEDISKFEFGYLNNKGHFIDREQALRWAVDEGILSPHDLRHGALTSTLLNELVGKGGGTLLADNTAGVGTGALRNSIRNYDIAAFRRAEQLRRQFGVEANTEVGRVADKALDSINEALNFGRSIGAPGSTLLADSSQPGTALGGLRHSNRFYSAVERAVEQARPETSSQVGPRQPNPNSVATGEQWLGSLQNKPGVKPEELDWIGLRDFLKENGNKNLTRQEVSEFVANNRVQLKEVQNVQWSPIARDLDGILGKLTKNIQTPADIAAAKKSNANFRETVKGMTDEQILQAVNHTIQLQETGGGLPRFGPDRPETIKLTLPGGSNYREVLLTLPERQNPIPTAEIIAEAKAYQQKYSIEPWESLPLVEQQAHINRVQRERGFNENNYVTSHWPGNPNVLAHVRVNERPVRGTGDTNQNGVNSLHLEEIQSDWHQAGRDRGYRVPVKEQEAMKKRLEEIQAERAKLVTSRSPEERLQYGQLVLEESKLIDRYNALVHDGVPDAPFKKNWHELALRRMLMEAASRGFERLSWTPGEAQAARYNLANHVDEVQLIPRNKNTDPNFEFRIDAYKNGERILTHSANTEAEVAAIVGKELAKKLFEQQRAGGRFGRASVEGLDLKMGGEGMRGFYDQIIPKSLEKITKEWGVRVQRGEVPFGGKESWLVQRNGENVSFPNQASAMADAKKNGGFVIKDTAKGPVFYIDIPPNMRQTINNRGMQLFSAAPPFTLTPVDFDPWNRQQ